MRNTIVTLEVTNTEYGTVDIFTHVFQNNDKLVYNVFRDVSIMNYGNPTHESVNARMTANVWHNGNVESYVFADYTLESLLVMLDTITNYGERVDTFTDRIHAHVTSDKFRYCL